MASKARKIPTPFQVRAYKLCYAIPRGKVTTYGSMAKQLGVAPRAVGQAMRTNPYAPEIPCHRVVAADLTLGGYSGSTEPACGNLRKKTTMLKEEGVRFVSDVKIDSHSLYQYDGTELAAFDGKWPAVIVDAERAIEEQNNNANKSRKRARTKL